MVKIKIGVMVSFYDEFEMKKIIVKQKKDSALIGAMMHGKYWSRV
jgi:hypothetical protein